MITKRRHILLNAIIKDHRRCHNIKLDRFLPLHSSKWLQRTQKRLHCCYYCSARWPLISKMNRIALLLRFCAVYSMIMKFQAGSFMLKTPSIRYIQRMHLPMTTVVDKSAFFSQKALCDIGLNSKMISVLSSLQIERPSKIQALSFSSIYSGKHCIIGDQTGRIRIRFLFSQSQCYVNQNCFS